MRLYAFGQIRQSEQYFQSLSRLTNSLNQNCALNHDNDIRVEGHIWMGSLRSLHVLLLHIDVQTL